MIIGFDLIVQLGLNSDFGHKIPELDETVIPMKKPGSFICKPDLTKPDMQEDVIQSRRSGNPSNKGYPLRWKIFWCMWNLLRWKTQYLSRRK